MNLNGYALEINHIAHEHGWWDHDRNFGEMVALMHSELSEALEAHREKLPPLYTKEGKPEGWAVELVDCMIRILDTLYASGIDIDTLMNLKIAYNNARPYKHGGKAY